MGGNTSKFGAFGKILVIRLCGLGDFILSLPFLSGLRRTFPQARIDLIAHPPHNTLIQAMGLTDRFVSEQKARLHLFYKKQVETESFSGFDPLQYDLIIPFTNPQGALVQNLHRITRARVHPIRPIPPSDSPIHVVEYLLSQRPDGMEGCEPFPRITSIVEASFDGVESLELQIPSGFLGGRLLAVHPGSGSKRKNWPANYFAELLSRLKQMGGIFPFLIEGPADGDTVDTVLKDLGEPALPVVRHPDLLQLGSLLLRSHLYLGNDSGVTHLAAALGRPVIALFGPSDPRVWGPRGDSVYILWKQQPCFPCHLVEDISCRRLLCMESIDPEDVLEVIESQNWGSS